MFNSFVVLIHTGPYLDTNPSGYILGMYTSTLRIRDVIRYLTGLIEFSKAVQIYM